MHRTILVVDVEAFGDRRRATPHQLAVREGLYRALRRAFSTAGVSWDDCDHEDRGDGVFVLAPADMRKAPFVESVPLRLVEALSEHNRTHPVEERIRLRMVLHAGEVAYDEHGETAPSIILAFRLLEAKPLKTALAESPGVLALITSSWFFDEVVRHSPAADPTTFRPVRVSEKETSTVAWISLPDHPYTSDVSVLTAPPPELAAEPVPRQLPAAPRSFVGRTAELATLTTALDSMTGRGGTVVISAIAGAGGIGKTWLALHWAHQHADRFPDGQLFVDLRGFSPDGKPMRPDVAVRGFLDAFGVDTAQIPADPHAQAARYRSLVAGKRMLIVLDNAATTEQITPLLPGGQACTVLVTSRRALTTLISRHGAHHLHLRPLTTDEAHALLTDRLGAERVAAEPDAVAELVRFCRGFALALGLIAGRAYTHPRVPLAQFAVELRDLGLDALDDDDPTASLPTVLSWSYQALSTEHQTVFGLLGIAPGPDIALPAAANLTGLRPAQAMRVLRALEEASLLDQDAHGRYAMHDLIRAYATTTAHDRLAGETREAALQRVLDFYIHTAHTADRLLHPHRPLIRLDPPTPGRYSYSLPDTVAALAWLDTEHPNLLAAQHSASTHAWHNTVWQLAWTLTIFHFRRGHIHDDLAMWQAALNAAGHLPDPTTHIYAHRCLGYAYAKLGRHDEATGHLDQALAMAEHHHDPTHRAHTHYALAWACDEQGDHRRALDHATHALHLYRTLNLPVWEARALNEVGWYAARLGEYDTARAHCQAALNLRRHHNLGDEAATLDSLGYIDHHTGHPHQAIDNYQQALTLYREQGNTYEAADTLDHLGHSHAALGQREQAQAVWWEALELYQAQHRTPDAERVQRQLDTLDGKESTE